MNVKKSAFLLELRARLPEEIFPRVLLALKQDALIWHNLENTELGAQSLASFSDYPEQWNPATLAFLELKNTYPQLIDILPALQADPAYVIDEGIICSAAGMYQEWLDGVQKDLTLDLAGLVALIWRNSLQDSQYPGQLVADLQKPRPGAGIALACLFGMLPEVGELIVNLVQAVADPYVYDLVLHALFSNPLTEEQQIEIIQSVLAVLSSEKKSIFLRKLACQRPELSVSSAKHVLETSSTTGFTVFDGNLSFLSADEMATYYQDVLSNLVQSAEFHILAMQPQEGISDLMQSIQMLQSWQGHLSAHLARMVEQARLSVLVDDNDQSAQNQLNTLDTWRGVVKLLPEETAYSIALGAALVEADRMAEAQPYLGKDTQVVAAQPGLSLLRAQAALHMGDPDLALDFASQSLLALENGAGIDEQQAVGLITLFQGLKKPAQALRAAEIVSSQYPGSYLLHALLAELQTAAVQPHSALQSTAQALALLPKKSEIVGRDILIDQGKLRRLFIQNLELIGEWETALEELCLLVNAQTSPELEDLLNLARCALKVGKPNQAVTATRQALEIDPDNDQAISLSAQVLVASGDSIAAIEQLQKAIHRSPHHSDHWLTLAQAYQMNNQPAKAIEVLRTASQALPDVAEIHSALGELYLSQNQATQALSSFRLSEKLAGSPRGTWGLGKALVHLGHLSEARQLLSRVIERPEYRQSEVRAGMVKTYAQVLHALGEYPQAVKMFIEAIDLCPDDLQARLALAQALIDMGDQSAASQAIEHLDLLLEGISLPTGETKPDQVMDPTGFIFEIKIKAALAEACRIAGDFQRAFDNYRQVLEVPDLESLELFLKPGVRSRLSAGFGQVAMMLNQPQTALTILKEALRFDSNDLTLQRLLSEAYLACGFPQEAFDIAQVVMDRNPASLEILTWFIDQGLRISETPIGDMLPVRQRVIQALDFASRLAPSRVDLLFRLGKMLVEGNNHSIALETFRRLAIAGDDLVALKDEDLLFAGKSLRKLGDTQSAMAVLQYTADRATSGDLENSQACRSEILAELAYVCREGGKHAQALCALEEVLSSGGQSFDLYRLQADLYEKLNQPGEQLISLKAALCMQPDHADLQLQVAHHLACAGELKDALVHAEQAVLQAITEKNDSLIHSARLEAAELAYRNLLTHKAWSFVQDDLAEQQSPCEHFEHACMRAEMALDAGDISLGSENLAICQRSMPQHAHTLACQCRLARAQGNGDLAENLFEAAQEAFSKENIGPAEQNEKYNDQRASLRVLASAAMELHNWAVSLSLIKGWVARFPDEPLASLRLAQALVLRAEDRVLGQELQLVKHAPGKEALSEQAFQEFTTAIQQARNTSTSSDSSTQSAEDLNDDLQLWHARGQAVFLLDRRSLHSLAAILKTLPVHPGSLRALILALVRKGEPVGALVAMENAWHLPTNGNHLLDDPSVLFAKALLLSGSEPQQAIELVQSILDQNPEWREWPGQTGLHYLQARLFYLLHDNSSAWRGIDKALEDWSDEPYWHSLAADILSAQVQPDLSGALEHLQQATSLQPDCAVHHLAVGKLYLQQRDAQSAASALEKATQLQPGWDASWLTLAAAQQMMGDLEQAASSAECAIATASDPIPALLLRSEIALQAKNPRGALSRIQTVLRSQPGHEVALQLAARALSDLDRPQEALEAIDKAIRVSSNAIPLYPQKIDLLRKAKGQDAALIALQEVVERYPECLELQVLLAESLFAAEQPGKAVEVAQSILRSDSNILPATQRSKLHFQVGHYMRNCGQLDQALDQLSLSLQCDPGYLEALLELGRVYQEQRAHNQALKTYLRAVDLAPQDYRPYYQVGYALKEAKDYVKAEEMLRQAARLAPDELSVHRLLGAVVALNLVHNRHSPVAQTRWT